VIRKIEHASPIDISKDTIAAEPETIHDNKVIALRHPKYNQIFKVSAIAEKHIRSFFDQQHFTQINSPKLIGYPTEG
jgi:nondiscriminating aspartyl-tRNA synthetase